MALASVPLAAQENLVQITPPHPRQGEALFVRLSAPARGARITWRGRTYPLYAQGEGSEAVIPINPDTPAGAQKLTLHFERDGRPEQVERTIPIGAVQFAVQHLKMATGTARLYNFPGAKREDAIVTGAIRTRSAQQLWHGDWSLPAQGPLSTQWGVRRTRNGKPVGRHKGLDIAAGEGAPISAPAAGRVVMAGTFKKYGGAVVLDHGQGVTSLYMHMSAVAAKQGQVLEKGAAVGRVGHTGVATGPHLHWSVYAQGQSVQPLFFCRLSKAGVSGQ